MPVQTETTRGVTMVTPGFASLDVSTVKDFKREMAPLLKVHTRMLFDLSTVTFVDSSGVRVDYGRTLP